MSICCRGQPGVHELVWGLSFVSFFFLYPSTFNILEVRLLRCLSGFLGFTLEVRVLEVLVRIPRVAGSARGEAQLEAGRGYDSWALQGALCLFVLDLFTDTFTLTAFGGQTAANLSRLVYAMSREGMLPFSVTCILPSSQLFVSFGRVGRC